jgi:hypothetical protein
MEVTKTIAEELMEALKQDVDRRMYCSTWTIHDRGTTNRTKEESREEHRFITPHNLAV